MQKDHGTSAKHRYIRALFAQEDPLLQEMREVMEQRDRAIQIAPEEGKLLQLIIRMHKVKHIVEMGTLAGYSTLWMARALPSDGHIWTVEKEAEHVKIAQELLNKSDVANRITVMEGLAPDVLSNLPEEAKKPDLVFIDADKPSYLDYLDWAEEHVPPGGLIIGDNSYLFGAVYSDDLPHRTRPATKKIMREFNQRLSDKTRYHSILLDTEQGMTIALKHR